MLAKTLASYSAPWQDAEAIANPVTEQPASSMNRIAEDSAQMTRTSTKIMVEFETSSGGAGSLPVIDATSQWGEGVSFTPTLVKTSTNGVYLLTYAIEYDDALVGTTGNEAVEETEQVVFRFAWGTALHATGPVLGHVRCTSVDNVITVYVFNAAGVLSDLGGGATVQIFAR